MQLAKVIGTVVATRKEDSLIGFKLLVLETLGVEKEGKGGHRLVAVDTLGAGAGDTVLFVTGGAARIPFPERAPIDASIVGIVDSIDVQL